MASLGTSTGRLKNIKENWNLAYAAGYLTCPLPEYDSSDPLAWVSVISNKDTPHNINTAIPITDLANRPKLGELSVCIKPLHYEFNRAVWLVEFIEMYKIMGASRFIFYNHTVGPDVQRVLEYYQGTGLVEVLPWSLPVKTQKVGLMLEI